jgi:hypothetical protein
VKNQKGTINPHQSDDLQVLDNLSEFDSMRLNPNLHEPVAGIDGINSVQSLSAERETDGKGEVGLS